MIRPGDANRRGFCRALLGSTTLGLALRGARGTGQTAGSAGEGEPIGRRPFPPDDPWNMDVSKAPVDPASDILIGSIGPDVGLHPDFGTTYLGQPNGIPYNVVPGTQSRVPVRFEYPDESDPGGYPIPADAAIEGGPGSTGDRHVLVIDRDNWKLYELFSAYPEANGASWRAGSGAIFDLSERSDTQRPAGWTSADAAGLPIFPGLARYEEAVGPDGIHHALRFTCRQTRRAYVAPARHFASRSSDERLPPMGMRVRLKADYDIDRFPAQARAILLALKRYGMILADNGGNWFISGAPEPRWDVEALATLKRVRGRDLEVVKLGPLTTR